MSDLQLTLLGEDGALRRIPLAGAPAFARPTAPLRSRVVYAAVHVVPLVHGDNTPGAPARIDWDATLAFRRTMWSRGLGVADAMDTAQRGMGLDPAATRELITRTADAAREALEDPEISAVFPAGATVSDLVVAGVNTDQRTEQDLGLDEIVEAYVEQLRATERAGAGAVLMASRHLARTARSAADYEEVYRRVLAEATAAFYRKIAGLPLTTEGDEEYSYFVVEAGGVQLALHSAEAFADYAFPPVAESNLTHLYFRIPDQAEFLERIKNAGTPLVAVDGVVVTVEDPDGRKVMFGTA